MTFLVDWYHVLGLGFSLIGAFWTLARMLVSQSQRHIDAQFKVIAETLKSQDEGSRRIERELMELKVELPRDYVRRQDHDRVIGGVQLSIDNLRLTLERFMLGAGGR